MSPIERAARAMYANIDPEWDWDDPDAELLRRMYRDNARVAIQAVREPSAAMQAAAITCTDAASLFATMIDAALAED